MKGELAALTMVVRKEECVYYILLLLHVYVCITCVHSCRRWSV